MSPWKLTCNRDAKEAIDHKDPLDAPDVTRSAGLFVFLGRLNARRKYVTEHRPSKRLIPAGQRDKVSIS